jgi:RNA polymerase sigma-70 factor, ECF subfamily
MRDHRRMSAETSFSVERPRLVGLAYRLLGSLTDAEDVVQEAWIRWSAADHATIERPAAWLTTVVSRLGLDRLRARQRSLETYVGPWLPEPLVEPMTFTGPEDTAELADSLTTAFLVMLERLTAEERLTVLLVDVFDEPFASVAALIGKSPDACRQLAVRARRKLATEHDRVTTDRQVHLAIATTFVAAVMNGDFDVVRSMLTDDAELSTDGGRHRHAARRAVVGPERITRFLINIGKRLQGSMELTPVWVNGDPGLLASLDGVPYSVSVLLIRGDKVHRQYTILNPDKLSMIGRSIAMV